MTLRQKVALILGSTILVLGWWLAAPGYRGSGFNDTNTILGDSQQAFIGLETTEPALNQIMEKSYFSAPSRAPAPPVQVEERPSKPEPVIVKPALPSGLDRFHLVAIINVRGSPVEALLADRGSDGIEILSATTGTHLPDAVILKRIEGNRVLLKNAHQESRWLELFPRPDLTANMSQLTQ